MSNKTRISVRNPSGMRPEANTRPDKYHRGHMDTEWQKNLILSHQPEDAVYLRKVERGDAFRFTYHCTDNTDRRLDIIDCDGVVVLSDIAQTLTVDVPGALTEDGSQYHSYLHRLSDLSAITEDGQYYLLLTVTYDLINEEVFISHPFHLKDTHEDTILLEYSHSQNLGWDYFEQLPCTYRFRVEGYIGPLIAKSVSTVYEGQSQSFTQLDRTAYREFTACYGETGEGICDWVFDMLNHIYDCDTVRHDGKLFLPSNNANFEKQGEGYPLFAAYINLREPDNPIGLETGGVSFILYISAGYPYAIGGIYIGPSQIRIGGPVVIDDATEEDDYIDAVNAALEDMELTGSVTITAAPGTRYIEYVNGDGENFQAGVTLKYNDIVGTFTVDVGAGLTNIERTARFTINNGFLVVDWGEGDAINADALTAPVQYSHIYDSAGGTFTYRAFGDVLESFELLVGPILDMDDFTGNLSPTFKRLTLAGFDFTSNLLDFDLFQNSPLMEEIAITESGLTTTSNLSTNSLPALATIDLSGNSFNAAELQNIVSGVRTNVAANGIYGGTLSVVQTPSIVPTLPTFLNINALSVLYGWTVNL